MAMHNQEPIQVSTGTEPGASPDFVAVTINSLSTVSDLKKHLAVHEDCGLPIEEQRVTRRQWKWNVLDLRFDFTEEAELGDGDVLWEIRDALRDGTRPISMLSCVGKGSGKMGNRR
jgi:hypothetical protein